MSLHVYDNSKNMDPSGSLLGRFTAGRIHAASMDLFFGGLL